MADATEKKKGGFLKWFGIAIVGIIVLAILLPSDDRTSSSSTETAAATPAVEVDAADLARAYAKNEVAAQRAYGDKPLIVSGVIEGISLDFANDPVVSFVGAEMFQSPQAGFSKDDADAVSKLNKGEVVTVRCESVSEVVSIPMLKDCKLQ